MGVGGGSVRGTGWGCEGRGGAGVDIAIVFIST